MSRILTLLCALLLLSGCRPAAQEPARSSGENGAAGSLKHVTLMLNWIPYGEHAPFYYGVEKGFYADEGLHLMIEPGKGSGRTIQAVGQKQYDFGYADSPALIKSIASGIPVRGIGVFLQTTPASVEFFAEKGIKAPADLKGRTVAITPGDAVSQTFPAFLAANGMKPADVKLVNVDAAGKVSTMIAGRVDAITGFFHDQAPTIESKSGKKVDVLRYADYGVNFLGTGLVAHNDTLKNDPELARAFLRASIRSWEEAAKDPAGAVDAMAKNAELAPAREVLREQLDKTLTLLFTKATTGGRPGVNAASDWQATIDVLAKYADLEKPGKPSEYWDASVAPK